MAKYSEQQKQEIYNLYMEGYSGKEIEQRIGIPMKTVHYLCRLKRITRSRGPKSMIELENYFQEIQTEEQAYWLGWLIADGCISIANNQYSIKLHISNTDSTLIERFLSAIKSKNKINYRDSSTYVSLTSKIMVSDLMSLGIRPRKSGNEQMPSIPKHLKPHMIRGYFDGDGITCIGISKRSGFCGSNQVLDFIKDEILLSPKIYKATGTNYFLLGKKESKILFQYLYKDSSIFLDRKYKRMNIICGNTEVTTTLTK